MIASKVPIYDYGTVENALFTGSNPPPSLGWISFRVLWTGGLVRMPVISKDAANGIFSGTFAQAPAKMEWGAAVGDFTFHSEPLKTSHSSFGEIGQEVNGSFLPP